MNVFKKITSHNIEKQQLVNSILIILFIYTPLLVQINTKTTLRARYLILFQGILLLLFFLYNKRKSIAFIHSKLFRFFIIFIGISLISSLLSSYRVSSLERLIILTFEVVSVFYFLENVENLKKLFELILRFTVFFAVIVCFYSIFLYYVGVYPQYGNGDNFLLIHGYVFSQTLTNGRAAAIFGNPNSFGAFAMIGFGSTLALSYPHKKWSYRLFFIITLLLGLFLSKSRSSMIGTGAILIIYIFAFLIERKKFKEALIISVLILIACLYIVLSIGSNLSGREVIWQIVIESIKEKPIFGVGFGVSTEVILSEFNLSTHNIYLKILSETGVIGFIAFLLIVLDSLISNLHAFIYSNKFVVKRLSTFFASSLIAIYFNQFFETGLFGFSFIFIFWLLLIIVPADLFVGLQEDEDNLQEQTD